MEPIRFRQRNVPSDILKEKSNHANTGYGSYLLGF